MNLLIPNKSIRFIKAVCPLTFRAAGKEQALLVRILLAWSKKIRKTSGSRGSKTVFKTRTIIRHCEEMNKTILRLRKEHFAQNILTLIFSPPRNPNRPFQPRRRSTGRHLTGQTVPVDDVQHRFHMVLQTNYPKYQQYLSDPLG